MSIKRYNIIGKRTKMYRGIDDLILKLSLYSEKKSFRKRPFYFLMKYKNKKKSYIYPYLYGYVPKK